VASKAQATVAKNCAGQKQGGAKGLKGEPPGVRVLKMGRITRTARMMNKS
jgi:hypothetical protein